MRNKKGFTLVELLVVIAIIGLLATIAFVALNQARAKARDAKRIADVRETQSALELYYNDQVTPSYPPSASILLGSTILSTTYMATIPVSPTPADTTICSGSYSGLANRVYNDYVYSAYTDSTTTGGACTSAGSCGWYKLSFCIGSPSGGLVAGVHTASPSGLQ